MTGTLSLLGSTGSIGTQALDVVRNWPECFKVGALAAGQNLQRLAQQVAEFEPELVAIQQESDLPVFRALLKELAPRFAGAVLAGREGLNAVAEYAPAQMVVVGLVGLVGLEPSLKALRLGKQLRTANKETFVAGGHLVAPYLSQIVPIDSEHVAIHQCLREAAHETVQALYLTASGGPFRTWSREDMQSVTREQALTHPNWVMGRKITVDSATMMNKGLEVIEAHWLFKVPYERIQVVVHPESMIHSGVAFIDGSILLQVGAPDMHGPIQYAMTYPERWQNPSPGVHLDLLSLSRLRLEPPDLERFPCIRLAYEAGRLGSGATAVLNGADEMAVQLFLDGRLEYCQLAPLLEKTLHAYTGQTVQMAPDLSEIEALDAWARAFVQEQSQVLA